NKFGIRRVYLHRPSYDPDVFVASSDLATPHLSTTRETIVEGGRPVSNPSFTPHCSMSSTSESSSSSNKSISLLLDWQNDGDNLKSDRSLNKLVENVLLNPHFRPADLIGFNTQRENRKRLDAASKLLEGFNVANIEIEVPSGDCSTRPCHFPISFHYRTLLSIIKNTFSTGTLASKVHMSPYKMFRKSPISGKEERVFSEIYDSDVMIEEHDKVQRVSLPPGETTCNRERVVAGLMFWSDMTHLANFGNAKLWPVYMMLGNLSKYVRSDPNTGACMHVAYLPSL
ncbi:hypothetical protein M378DRAFT_45182, partial [Amanita muscaria Koide BX008]